MPDLFAALAPAVAPAALAWLTSRNRPRARRVLRAGGAPMWGRERWVSLLAAAVMGGSAVMLVGAFRPGDPDPCVAPVAARDAARAEVYAADAEIEKQVPKDPWSSVHQRREQANRQWGQILSDSPLCFSPTDVATARQYLAKPR